MNIVKLAVMLALSTGLLAAIGGSTLPGNFAVEMAIIMMVMTQNVNTMMTTIAIVPK